MTPDARPDPWADVTAARVPAAGLAALAPARGRAGVRVRHVGADAWVTWPAGYGEVAECLRPVRGAVFFRRVGDEWFRFGHRVPTADGPPGGPDLPLDAVLIPARFSPVPPPVADLPRLAVTLVRGGPPRPTTALGCRVHDLLAWADGATTAELARVSAARCGDRALLRGATLPPVPRATRYWGETVLVPVGHRPDPDLSADVLRAAAGVGRNELLILGSGGAEAVPLAVFTPLTRAGVRLAANLT